MKYEVCCVLHSRNPTGAPQDSPQTSASRKRSWCIISYKPPRVSSLQGWQVICRRRNCSSWRDGWSNWGWRPNNRMMTKSTMGWRNCRNNRISGENRARRWLGAVVRKNRNWGTRIHKELPVTWRKIRLLPGEPAGRINEPSCWTSGFQTRYRAENIYEHCFQIYDGNGSKHCQNLKRTEEQELVEMK